MTSAVEAAPGTRTALEGRHIRGEMREQPDVLGNLARHVAHFADQTAALSAAAGAFDEVVFLAGGQAENAALLGSHAVQTRCAIPARVLTPAEPTDPVSASEDAEPARCRLAVVLCPSGSEPGVLALAAHYADSGATLVAVTNDVRCTLARSAALCVDLAAGLELAGSPTKSTTALMLAVLALVEGLPACAADADVVEPAQERAGQAGSVESTGNDEHAEGVEHAGRADETVAERDRIAPAAETTRRDTGMSDLPSAKALAQRVAELLEDTTTAEAAAARLVAARRIAVVGSGHHLPAALETARLLRDAAGLTVEGFSADGFRAGPFGGFDSGTTAVLLAGAHDQEIRDLHASLLDRGVPVVSISTLLGTGSTAPNQTAVRTMDPAVTVPPTPAVPASPNPDDAPESAVSVSANVSVPARSDKQPGVADLARDLLIGEGGIPASDGVAVRTVAYCDDAPDPDLAFPAFGTMAECILATVRGQQLAVAAAAARGVDPDRRPPLGSDR